MEQLDYIKRKNILVRGAYVFCTEDGKLIIFDNTSGKFHIANNGSLLNRVDEDKL